MVFCEWLLSLSINVFKVHPCYVSKLHIFLCQVIFHCMDRAYFLIHLLADGHQACFHLWWEGGYAHLGTRFCVWTYFLFGGSTPMGLELLGQLVALCFTC